MIQAVKESIGIPLIVGGGIRSAGMAEACCKAGADIIVVGNAFEKDLSLMESMCRTVHDVVSVS
jgi:putative glycerol-1-phosphate prenyltransferase